MSIFTQAVFDDFASALPGTVLHDQRGSRLAKIGGKIYAVHTHGTSESQLTTLAFKVPLESFEMLTRLKGVSQAPYFARGQWVAASAGASIPEEELRERIVLSYEIVRDGLPRKMLATLGIKGGPDA